MLAVGGSLLGSVLCFLEVIKYTNPTSLIIYMYSEINSAELQNCTETLCYFFYSLQGSFFIIESYLQYLQALSHGSASEHGHHIVHLLIEAMGT